MLKSIYYGDYKTATIFGEVYFDKDGIAQGLTLEQERALSVVADYEFTEPEPEKPKAPAKPKTAPKAKPAAKEEK
ncbi:hypothetical protein BPS13_0260 [Bacillus phage BPS13]|nr:hypothetical protein BPS13_0260 [Bacillus phage BPS13]YP_009003148.1 hypothetical protein BPS10C_262 [Bacillus phage BPS10C]AEZ50439.1 hypothetical protein BPS13_0260 [Bacillus phage BPS13]AGI12259.1 hypothetical protein BPS10C_262 [Bacillus phage BPS10C]